MNRDQTTPQADWQEIWTAHQAEHQMKGFKFEGPGWYAYSEHVLLVIPLESNNPKREYDGLWSKNWPISQKFRFFVYNGRNPADIFNAIVNAPTRVDMR